MTPSEFVAEREAQLKELVAIGKIGSSEMEYICKDGSCLWMRFAGRDLGGGSIGELCIEIPDPRPIK